MEKTSTPFLLSDRGSDRATAYGFSNKIVALGGATHVVWLDSVSRVRGRTYDHAKREWSEVVEIGDGYDNHCTPSLTADSQGRLHVAFGPHGCNDPFDGGPRSPCATGQFRYAVAPSPNSLDGLGARCERFGYAATYASLVIAPDDTPCIVYRGGERPRKVVFQKRQDSWTFARALMRKDIPPVYTHYGQKLVCHTDGTLYAGCHFYHTPFRKPYDEAEACPGLAVLKSTDLGETWTDLSGEPADTPITYGPRFAPPHPPRACRPYLNGMAVDPGGRPWVHAASPLGLDFGSLVSRWDGAAWRAADLADFLPPDRGSLGGPMCVDTRGRVHVVVTAVDLNALTPGEKTWGHPSNEVFHLMSSNGGKTFDCKRISDGDPAVANWLPAISQAGPHHPVDLPVILYTKGRTGRTCRDPIETEVYCAFVADA